MKIKSFIYLFDRFQILFWGWNCWKFVKGVAFPEYDLVSHHWIRIGPFEFRLYREVFKYGSDKFYTAEEKDIKTMKRRRKNGKNRK